MGTVEDVTALYETAMNLSRAAFAGRHYAVAYHGLAAAMHAAYDLDDADRLAAVGEASREQDTWINDHDPEHELSARSATSRNMHSLWAMLQQEVHTRQQMLQQRRLIRQSDQPQRGAN